MVRPVDDLRTFPCALFSAASLIGSTTCARPGWVEVAGGIALFGRAREAVGPTGASACMITASENNAQGGIMAAFNYDNRVLNGDPFLVNISS